MKQRCSSEPVAATVSTSTCLSVPHLPKLNTPLKVRQSEPQTLSHLHVFFFFSVFPVFLEGFPGGGGGYPFGGCFCCGNSGNLGLWFQGNNLPILSRNPEEAASERMIVKDGKGINPNHSGLKLKSFVNWKVMIFLTESCCMVELMLCAGPRMSVAVSLSDTNMGNQQDCIMTSLGITETCTV